MIARARNSLLFWSLGLFGLIGILCAAEPTGRSANPTDHKPTEARTQTSLNPAIKPKPLADYTLKGLAYLVNQQDSGGGFGQGGGWRQKGNEGRVEGKDVKDPPDVGNTCAATLALIRAGNSPKEGPYANNVAKAFGFICEHVEKADSDSLYVTDVRDTQLQRKIGTHVDTFLTALVLSELKGQMSSDQDEARLSTALSKTIAKIERNQKEDGTFAGNVGWASVLSQSVCTKALNRAAQKGVAVKTETLARDFNQAVAGLDVKSGEFKLAGAGAASRTYATARPVGAVASTGGETTSASIAAASAPSDAGVQIYSSANNANRVQELANTNIKVEHHAREVLADSAAPEKAKREAKADLERVAKVAEADKSAVGGLIRRLDDKQFLAGFGNNGGEEFLSYMNLSETLLAKGGTDWLSWDKGVSENLRRVQNQDGSWSGQHCITGRTFCTSAALLTLMADRAPVPVADRIKAKK